ncbi:MAG TPA: cytochrome ubiquinol oxidase subunit I, partial [Ramlibacter sp.]|nr:cytochrome ubiquinol oxidase subunit I [Ramlibacter sp.]
GAALTLFGIPNEREGRTDYAVQLPRMASLVLAHDADAELQGLDAFPGAHPPVAPVFWGFRVMVGTGVLMLALSWALAWRLWRQRTRPAAGGAPFTRLQLRLLATMTFSGWIATLAGWIVTEVGRQPFMVYGQLRTAELVAQHPPGTVLATLLAYLAVYAFLLVSYVLVLMYMAQHPAMPMPEAPQGATAATPIGGPAWAGKDA